MKAINNNRILRMISFLMIMFLISINAMTQMSFHYPSLDNIYTRIYHNGNAYFINFHFVPSEAFSEEIALEDWMIYPSDWTNNTESVLFAAPEDFMDEQVEIEYWMIEPDWNTESAEEIQIEDWMINPAGWSAKNALTDEN